MTALIQERALSNESKQEENWSDGILLYGVPWTNRHKGNNSVIIRWEGLLVPTLHLLWDHLRLKMILQLNRPTGYIK